MALPLPAQRISSLKVANGSVSLANGHSAGCATNDDDVEDVVHVLSMCPQDTVVSTEIYFSMSSALPTPAAPHLDDIVHSLDRSSTTYRK